MAPHEINENPTTNIYTQIEKESTLMFLSANVVCMLFQYSIQTKSQKKNLTKNYHHENFTTLVFHLHP